MKTLTISDTKDAKVKVPDLQVFGEDVWKLIAKVSSNDEQWMKSTKAMQCGTNVVIQVTTQQRNGDMTYSIAESLCTVPNSKIIDITSNDKIIARKIINT